MRSVRRGDERATHTRHRLALSRRESVTGAEAKIAQAEGSRLGKPAPNLLIGEPSARQKIGRKIARSRERRGHALRENANLSDGHQWNAHHEFEENGERIVHE